MSELQIKALQPKAQPPTPSCNIYTTAKRSMHTWESAGSLLNLQERVCVCVCVCVCMCVCARAPSCLTLCDPRDCSLPGSSVHGYLPGRNTGVGCHFLLQRIFPTLDQTLISCISCISSWILLSLCPQGSMSGEGINYIAILIICFK